MEPPFDSVIDRYCHGRQIRSSPLFKGAMFTLRQDRQVAQWIGEDLVPSNQVRFTTLCVEKD
jgi:hypothetical protein